MYKVGDQAVMVINRNSGAGSNINYSLKNTDIWIFPVEITKVDDRYITAKRNDLYVSTYRFYVNYNHAEIGEYGGAYSLKPSFESVINEFKEYEYYEKIKMAFCGHEKKYTLEQLEEVAKILGLDTV